jgi:hypothetical protein
LREGNGAGVEAGLRGGVGGGGDCGGRCGWCGCGDGGGGEEARRVKAVGLPVCEERQVSSIDCAKLSVSRVRGLKMWSSESAGGVGERIRLEAIDTGARFSDSSAC